MKIINIILSSIDGKIAFHPNESTAQRRSNSFTCSEDFSRLQNLIAQSDVIFIGERSIASEDGAIRVAHLRADKAEPQWIIFKQAQAELNFTSKFWSQQGIPKSIFFVSSLAQNSAPILNCIEKEFSFGKLTCYYGNIVGLLNYLRDKHFKQIALLGGGRLNTAFWENNLVDELYLTLSPFAVGGFDAPNFLNLSLQLKQRLQLVSCEYQSDFVFLHYIVSS